MPHEPLTYDLDLQRKQLQDLTGPDEVAGFFRLLGYPGVERLPQTPENLGISAGSTLRAIESVELIADQPEELQVFLFELRSVTVNHRKALVRAFKTLPGKFLLVVTTRGYEHLDFVLLDTLRAESESENSPFAASTPKVLPRVYSLDRRNPEEPLAVRVLRRFTWTETDGYAQHDKLRSAFELATWSEPEFNNRALFSDHYLKTRLPEVVQDWKDAPKPAYQELSKLFRKARERLGQAKRQELRRELLDPALEVLGFEPGEDLTLDDDNLIGGRLLFDGAATESPLALCLDFPWGRSLDAKDEIRDTETGDLNPGVRVVKLLEADQVDVPWIILTNGQIWRLYGRQAHSRATNYYEIDVEEVVSPKSYSAEDPRDPFRFFWLLFRRQAFEPRTFHREGRQVQEPLLTHLWVESGEYAKDLGERLKERIFDRVFETLARGFLASRSSKAPPTQEELDEAFEGTLTFLYRILFLLYAEARDLLPVRDVRGYYESSLKRLLREVATAAGTASSQVEDNLVATYATDGRRTFYERLLELFAIVDGGKPSINVPKYNGGLFLTQPDPEDDLAEARTARFLQAHRLADLPLARALDLMARDEDEKSHALVPIDYKSLGVRHLGSIYEGLLEFRLRVAAEPLAVVLGKGKKKKVEQVVPLKDAREEGLKIRRTGRSKDSPELIFDAGEIYLENDKQERHLTGSYYTPDFVVEYIVRKTLRPILEEKLEVLRPKLREAEEWHQRRTKKAKDPRSLEDPRKYDFGPCVESTWRKLIQDAFDIKVLDPAMGSGHFLVEAVDFITDEVLRFLGAFPWNPVFAHLQHLRHTILKEMESEGITIDPDRLTDTHLLKRHVLKRCIFGVDVNPMAVELAKVSLWLDCFTLGAPLSFLEHHLRRGNSLLGTTVQEARKAIEHQLPIFGSRFAGMALATLSMIEVGGMPDVTTGQLTASRSTFEEGSQALAPYLRLLHFFLAHVIKAREQKKNVEDKTVILELIRSQEAEQVFSDRPLEDSLEALNEADRQLAEQVLAQAQDRGFFHWQLEFPEVFFSVRSGSERLFELDPEGGFDAVVGNPPWIRQESLKGLKPVLGEIFGKTYDSIADIYVYLLTRGLQELRPEGRLGMILQNKWFKATYGEALRTYLTTDVTPLEVIDFGHAPLFDDADTFPCILLVKKSLPPNDEDASVGFFDVKDLHRNEFPGLDLDEYGKDRRGPVLLRRLRAEGWELLPKEQGDLMEKLRASGPTLVDYVGQSPQRGILTGFNEAFLIDQETRDHLIREDPNSTDVIQPYLRGQDIERWIPKWDGQWMIRLASSQNWDWPWRDARNEMEAETTFRETYPALHRHMKSKEARLRKRQDRGRFWWELRSCDYYETFDEPKILYKEIMYHARFAWDDSQFLTNNKCFALSGAEKGLLAILNSSLAWWYFTNVLVGMKDDALAMQADRVVSLPLPERLNDLSSGLSERVNSISALRSEAGERPRSSDLRRKYLKEEAALQKMVFSMYRLSSYEIQLVRHAKAPRDPLLLAEEKLAKLEREERKSK